MLAGTSLKCTGTSSAQDNPPGSGAERHGHCHYSGLSAPFPEYSRASNQWRLRSVRLDPVKEPEPHLTSCMDLSETLRARWDADASGLLYPPCAKPVEV
ncbi:hypothetical protein CDV36_008778 [Fusarium kuroshium]|uniref:Uncharacterized protein n=1 Tax=Fusarium kuroshium TaxID=2010991 RepID=A0A3M2S2L3_9HYPO|nr:hypothetical protein CDV36_008778 [Fusarium kuroshium]